MLPHFFVIGAQKAGSTYLLDCLNDHPQIYMPPQEVAFFEESLYSPNKIDEFERNFDPARPGQIVGVKRPNLLGHPECPERLIRHMPDLKIVAILRHPIDRAISGYFHYMKTGLLPIVPAEIGLQKILDGQYTNYPRAHEVLEFGLYGKHLRHYADYFPRENMLVMFLEDMKHDVQGQLSRLYDFVGVSSDYRPASIATRPMQAPYSITRLRLWDALDRHCRVWNSEGNYFTRQRGIIRTPLATLNNAVDRVVWSRLFSARRPKLPQELHQALAAYYREDAKCLEEWLGRRVTSWSDLTDFAA